MPPATPLIFEALRKTIHDEIAEIVPEFGADEMSIPTITENPASKDKSFVH